MNKDFNLEKEVELEEEAMEEQKDQEATPAEDVSSENTSTDEDSSNNNEEKKDKEQEDSQNQYLRLMADFQNYRKRTEKEKSSIYAYANEKIMEDMLSVLDNFERALEHSSGEGDFKEGMEMIFKEMKGVLEKAGLAELSPLGEDFDPNFHNAVMTGSDSNYESGKVIDVMQKGYLLNGKLLRAAMVKVND